MRYRRSILCLVVLSLCARGTAEDCDGNGIEDELELVDRLAVEARYDGDRRRCAAWLRAIETRLATSLPQLRGVEVLAVSAPFDSRINVGTIST